MQNIFHRFVLSLIFIYTVYARIDGINKHINKFRQVSVKMLLKAYCLGAYYDRASALTHRSLRSAGIV